MLKRLSYLLIAVMAALLALQSAGVVPTDLVPAFPLGVPLAVAGEVWILTVAVTLVLRRVDLKTLWCHITTRRITPLPPLERSSAEAKETASQWRWVHGLGAVGDLFPERKPETAPTREPVQADEPVAEKEARARGHRKVREIPVEGLLTGVVNALADCIVGGANLVVSILIEILAGLGTFCLLVGRRALNRKKRWFG